MQATLETDLERAIHLQRTGDSAAAEALYRAVLDGAPDQPVANHNLAVLLAQRSQAAASLPLFRRAVQAEPTQQVYWLSYARGLVAAGAPEEALTTLDEASVMGHGGPQLEALRAQARARGPSNASPSAESLDKLGQQLAGQGRLDEAVKAFEAALSLDPDFPSAHFHLGSVYSEGGDVAHGFFHFMRRAALIGGETPGRAGAGLPHKRKHDLEQRDYLAAASPDSELPPVTDYFRTECGERVLGRAVNPRAADELVEAWRSASPQAIVIDGFLTPPALEALRGFCARSTVWRRVYPAGYIGATPEDGFACPLLAQIVEETRETYTPILEGRPFRYLGGFKYDSALSTGTNTHADNSAVNLNLYITPDEANLDPESGGMEIWDASPANEAEMRRLNSDEAAAKELLRRSGARSRRIPHRANRAVLFRSDLMHKTDRFAFREGYLDKRINISMLFGDRAC